MGRHAQQRLLHNLQLSVGPQTMPVGIPSPDWSWVQALFLLRAEPKHEDGKYKKEEDKGILMMTPLGLTCSRVLGLAAQ